MIRESGMPKTVDSKSMLSKFKLGYDAVKATENIRCVKDESTVDHSAVTRWFKEILLEWQESWSGKVK